MPETIGGKYEIEESIGRGGMGEVFAARHAMTGRRVAVKRLLPHLSEHTEAVERFLREARAAGGIDHKNIVAVFDADRDGDEVFIVMELLKGEPLSDRVKAGPLAPDEAIETMLGVLRGVGAAHAHSVVHRDIKPENIFLAKDSDGVIVPKVLDFGISKIAEENASAGLTDPGSVLGTIQYMAPEQVRSQAVDHRADIYALGVMLYRMLTGKFPFNGTNLADISLQIMGATAPPITSHVAALPAALEDVVRKAMARDAGDRYQDVAELSAALQPLAAHGAVSAAAASASSAAAAPSADTDATANTDRSAATADDEAPTPTPFAVQTGRSRRPSEWSSLGKWLWPAAALVSLGAGIVLFQLLVGDEEPIPAAAGATVEGAAGAAVQETAPATALQPAATADDARDGPAGEIKLEVQKDPSDDEAPAAQTAPDPQTSAPQASAGQQQAEAAAEQAGAAAVPAPEAPAAAQAPEAEEDDEAKRKRAEARDEARRRRAEARRKREEAARLAAEEQARRKAEEQAQKAREAKKKSGLSKFDEDVFK